MSSDPHDWRYEELRRLGEAEREMSAALLATRARIAGLVAELLPQHAPARQIEQVVRASGYGRSLVDALRSKNHPWSPS